MRQSTGPGGTGEGTFRNRGYDAVKPTAGLRGGISVIIPTYNRSQDILPAVESVLAQTRPAAELLLIDDGSTDDSTEILETLPPNVRVIRQENAGVSAARNRGIAAARGDFIAFLDVDDRWKPEKLEVQMATLAGFPEAGWCATNLQAVDPGGIRRATDRGLAGVVPVLDDLGYSLNQWLEKYLASATVAVGEQEFPVFHGSALKLLLHGNFIFPSTVLMRRSLVERIGGFDATLRRAEDNDYFLRAAEEAQLAVLTEPLVEYRTGESDALTASGHSSELVSNALECLRRAAERRHPLGPAEREAYKAGRSMLLRRKSYLELTNLNRLEARHAMREYWKARGGMDWRSLPLFLATYLPSKGLGAIAALKRALKRIVPRRPRPAS